MSASGRPRVVVHNAVSVDGRIDGFEPRIGAFYALARTFGEDVTLAGSDTILAAASTETDGPPGAPSGQPAPEGPLLVVPDSRGRIVEWEPLRVAGIWRGVLALCARSTPPAHLERLEREGVPYAVCGDERVDLRAALELLARDHGARTVRVDSGGRLNGALLRAGLVDEVSLLVHPVLVGGRTPRSMFVADDLPQSATGIPLGQPLVEKLEDGLLWLRWNIREGQHNRTQADVTVGVVPFAGCAVRN